jgi:hypothetical protein
VGKPRRCVKGAGALQPARVAGKARGPSESYSDMTILRALKGDRAPVFASKRPALIEPALT